MSRHTTLTTDVDAGGPPEDELPLRISNLTNVKRSFNSDDYCPHDSKIGDKCVTSCRLCGIFIPKSGMKTLRN